jgi:beta-phosphoglucomutase-like phosphatase (HAD superfamily)
VIEDSPSGIRAALAARMWCIAVTKPFTQASIHRQQLLEERWVVNDPARLADVVREMVMEGEAD